jgi:hypothetical protein
MVSMSNPPGKPPLTGPLTKLPIGVVGVGGIDEAIGDCIGRNSIFTRKSSAPFCKTRNNCQIEKHSQTITA